MRKPSEQDTPFNFRDAHLFPVAAWLRKRKRRCYDSGVLQLLDKGAVRALWAGDLVANLFSRELELEEATS